METAKFYIPDHDTSPNRPRPLYCCEPGDRDQSGEYVKAEDARALEAEVARLKAQLAELREAIDSILCLAVEGPEACGYLETVTAIVKKASEADLKRLAGVEQERWTEEELEAAKAEGKRLAKLFMQDDPGVDK